MSPEPKTILYTMDDGTHIVAETPATRSDGRTYTKRHAWTKRRGYFVYGVGVERIQGGILSTNQDADERHRRIDGVWSVEYRIGGEWQAPRVSTSMIGGGRL